MHQLLPPGEAGRRLWRFALVLMLASAPIAGRAMIEEPASADPVARLQQEIDAGRVQLRFDAEHGYLPAVLEALDIPVSSQGLVFSKTSLQVDRISPWAPRAIYFNDDVYVGWVRRGPIVEFAAVDPREGAVFYTLVQEEAKQPQFRRESTTCLMCHESTLTERVPGFIMASVLPDRLGYATPTFSTIATTDRTPLEKRWGGWYVSGNLGDLGHMGNARSERSGGQIIDADREVARLDLHAKANLTDLSGEFNAEPYLSPHSDAVALLVLAHQTHVHNLITAVNIEARKTHYGPPSSDPARHAADRLVRAMLFVKEAPLPGPISGSTHFAHDFGNRGPRDRQGRSLRDLDLENRLFRYPLSFLIYSDAFDAIPERARHYIYDRLWDILTGREASEEFRHLSREDRRAILQILQETRNDFRRLATNDTSPGEDR